MLYLDFSILNFIQTHMRTAFGDKIMPIITALGNAGVVWIILAIVLCMIPKYRKNGVALIIALVLDVVFCNLLLKPIVARPRPFTINNDVKLLIKAPTDFSFPSGHTACAFSSAFSLWFGKNKLWIPAMILSVLIAFSRMYLYVHYPSDVLAGILLGFAVGAVSDMITKLIFRKFSKTE